MPLLRVKFCFIELKNIQYISLLEKVLIRLHCRSGCLKENIKLEKCKTGKIKDVTPLRTNKSGSSKENIKIKKCETENFKEVTPYRIEAMRYMKQDLVKFSYLVDGQVFLPK